MAMMCGCLVVPLASHYGSMMLGGLRFMAISMVAKRCGWLVETDYGVCNVCMIYGCWRWWYWLQYVGIVGFGNGKSFIVVKSSFKVLNLILNKE